jgi:DNA-directed RNA polymerase specialized sigma24 family protein
MRNSLKSKPKSLTTTAPHEEKPHIRAATEPHGPVTSSKDDPLSELSITRSISPQRLSNVFQGSPQAAPPVSTMPGAEGVTQDISRLVQSACHRTLPPLTEEILTAYLQQEDPTKIAEEAGASPEEVEETVAHALRALRGVRMPKSSLYN